MALFIGLIRVMLTGIVADGWQSLAPGIDSRVITAEKETPWLESLSPFYFLLSPFIFLLLSFIFPERTPNCSKLPTFSPDYLRSFCLILI